MADIKVDFDSESPENCKFLKGRQCIPGTNPSEGLVIRGHTKKGKSIKSVDIHVVLSPEAPQEAIEALAASKAWQSRYIVARHPQTPVELLEKLREDESVLVRKAALDRINAQS